MCFDSNTYTPSNITSTPTFSNIKPPTFQL